MASMQTIEKVNVEVADGGLAQVLELTNVNPLLKDLITEEGVTNLMEFASLWTKDGYEKETLEFRDRVDSLKGRLVEVSRLRIAILVAKGVLDRPAGSKDAAQSPPIDIEGPLDPLAKESMAKAWTARYHLSLGMWLDPADPLVNRLYREFRNNTPTLIPVARIKSVYSDNNPNPEKKVALAAGLVVTVAGKDQSEVVRDVAHYYFALRVLANASAKAGNYEVESKVEKETKVIFAPLDTNLEYADHAFRMALKQTGSAWNMFKWLEEKDLRTRGLMCNYMRNGWPQGEALTKALKETEIQWSSAGQHGGQEPYRRRERSRSPRGKGRGKGGKGPKKPVIGKLQKATNDRIRYANMATGNRVICRAFNEGHCKGENCPYGNAHVCSVINNGKACFGKHPACRHSFGSQGR